MAGTDSHESGFGAGTRIVAAVHFMAAGGLLCTVGGWLLLGYEPGPAMDIATELWLSQSSGTAVLDSGGALSYLDATTARVVGLCVVGVGGLQFVASACAYRGRGWTRCVGSGLVGAATVIAFPLSVVGLALVYLSRTDFASRST